MPVSLMQQDTNKVCKKRIIPTSEDDRDKIDKLLQA